MDNTNKAFMLELSYRLTVAVNMAERRLGSLAWMTQWNEDTLTCARHWNSHLLSSIVNGDTVGAMMIQIVNGIVNGLAQGYAGMVESPFAPSQDVHVYQYLLDETHKIAHAPVFAEWELPEFFIFGQQLAHNDLRTHFSSVDKADLPVTVSSQPKFMPLSDDSFPRSWPGWPINPIFSDCLVRYTANRRCFACPTSFSMGGLTSLALSIVCPSHFPSTAWCWQDWEGSKPWRLFLAGRHFLFPTLVTVKDKNDWVFVTLFEAMAKDKEKGHTVDDCGWVLRKELWPEIKIANTCSKAWSKLTKETLVGLGKFGFNGTKGKNKNAGGNCRLPAVFAEPDCQIFVEKLK